MKKKVSIGTSSMKQKESKKKKKEKLSPIPEPVIVPATPEPSVIAPKEEPPPKRKEKPTVFISQDSLHLVALNIARAESWKIRREHLKILQRFLLTFNDLSTIIHRIPSLDERTKAIDMLKDSVQDTPHQFYIFSQSFATETERNYLAETFQVPITNTNDS